ncbi:MAG TPA: hypothetical protein QGF58_26615 [Myxococcota bacterium]|nr:hypothetical protein [Myxococcota bacterium]
MILLLSCTNTQWAPDAVLPLLALPGCNAVSVVEGAFVPQGSELTASPEPCTAPFHATAGARDSTLLIESDAELRIEDLAGGSLSNPVVLQRSGEVLVHVDATDTYWLSVTCLEGCEAEYTRYPVVLMHGMGGSDAFGGVPYFFRVEETLEELGFEIQAPPVTPFATAAQRAPEWEVHLELLRAEGVGRKFNLLGHSQGGLDARYLVGGLGRADLVASITTVGSPHQGTRTADLIYGVVEDGTVDAAWVDVGAEVFAALFGLEGDDNSLVEAMEGLTTEAMAEFNETVPDDPEIPLWSWAGGTCGALEFDCQQARDGEIVDPLLAPTWLILWLDGQDSDGMVPIDSATWGTFLGELNADHADLAGIFEDEATDAFDHLAFYTDETRRLHAQGL